MGRLLDALRGKKEEQVQQEEPIITATGKYTRTFAMRVAMHNGYELNDDDKVNEALNILTRSNSSKISCPCTTMRTQGICKCGLFKNIEERKIKSSTSARIKVKED